MSYDYSENILVQESAGHLLQNELGWEVAFAYNTEQLGENGTFGRKSYKEILLTRYFQEALLRLNPWITPAQIDEAQRAMERRLSTSSLLQINEEKYFLIRDGIPVTVKKPDGKTEEKRAAVIDFQNPDNNHFLAVKELKIHGDLYRRRTDIVGFVNGIPLLFNGYMAIAKDFFAITENISYHVAAGNIKKDLLHKIMTAIMDGTFNADEGLKLEILNAIS